MINAPSPDLRIVATHKLYPHEEHDTQRSAPLIDRLRRETKMINPPIVTPLEEDHFVVLDGANRVHAFQSLGYTHILVQVASYESGQVELKTWNHIVSDWDGDAFLKHINAIPEIQIKQGHINNAAAHVLMRDGRLIAICSPHQTRHDRNRTLRLLVETYQRVATLHRSADVEPAQAWQLYPTGNAFVTFSEYLPYDILSAAKNSAFLPPGVSRHIVHGRALRVNYPMEFLRDKHTSLIEKNEKLLMWVQHKLANRQVRYYAEATYLFDE